MWKTRNFALRSPLFFIFCMMAPSSRSRGLLWGITAQSVFQRRVKEDFRRSTHSSSSSSSITDLGTPVPSSANPKATSVQGSTPVPPLTPTNDLFKQFIQEYMDDCRQLAPATALVEPREDALDRLLKAWNSDLYYGNLYIKCYYFCQQDKDHFKTIIAKGHKRVSFAITFWKDRILNR